MNLLVLDIPLFVEELRAAGHAVVNIGPDPACEIHLSPGQYTLDAIWSRLPAGFSPDRLLLSESLKRRRIPQGIAEAPCPTLFHSVDGHLHLDWHLALGRLFDHVLCSQLAVCSAMQAAGLRASWLPWAISAHEVSSDIESGPRDIPVSMVGSFLAAHRPKRMQLLERLARRFPLALYGPPFTPFLTPLEQAAIYGRSRIVLNECIGGEVNFRLLEAAAQGACVLSEQESEGQSLLLRPGREFVPWTPDTVEEELDRLLASPDTCHEIGRAGWQRLNADHTRTRRCAMLLESLELARMEDRRLEQIPAAPRLEHWIRQRLVANGLADPRDTPRAARAAGQPSTPHRLTGPLGDELLIGQAEELLRSGRTDEAESLLSGSESRLCLLALEAWRLIRLWDAQQLDSAQFVQAAQMLAQVFRNLNRRHRAGIVVNPERITIPCWEFQLLQLALRRLPDEPGLWLALARCEDDCGLTAHAVASMDSLMHVMHTKGLELPDELRLEHARLQWKAGLREAAEANLLRLSDSDWITASWLPTEERLRLQYVRRLVNERNITALELLATERPSSAITGLCCELSQLDHQPARGLSLLDSLIAKEPGSPRLHRLQERMLEQMGRHEESRMAHQRSRQCNILVRHTEDMQ